MTEHRFVEDAPLTGMRETADGYIVGEVAVGRTGIQDYHGAEFGMPELGRISVYRPEAEVFSRKSFDSFAGKPVTVDHPTEPVTRDNWKAHAVGAIGEEIVRDGERVRVPIVLMDGAAIDRVRAGHRELSLGYTMDLAFEDGTTPDGEPFQAVMRGIHINHLAIVAKGRAGPDVRIGDAAPAWGASPITDSTATDSVVPAVQATIDRTSTMSTRTIVVDGLTVETTDAGAAAIEKLQGDLRTARDATDAANTTAADAAREAKTAHDSAIADKDREIGAKDAKITELEGQILDAAALDALVAERTALLDKAHALVKDADFAGKTAHEIRAAVVAKVVGADAAAKSEAHVEGAFDAIKAPAPTDKVREALRSVDTAPAPTSDDNGYSGYVATLNDAWKGTKTEAA